MEWSGTTDFVAWSAEYVHPPNQKNRGSSRARWWAETTRGPAQPILLMGVPAGKENPAAGFAQGESLFARLAQSLAGMAFDSAVDRYFGKEAGTMVDAGKLKPVDGATLPGFIVRAGDPAEGARVLFAGVRGAIETATRDPQSALSDEAHRPWVLLLGRQVAIAKMEP
jgi:hypothetical protein